MAGTILKGISVIRGVKPKSNKITKLKASISKNVGETNKLNFKNEEGAEKILEMEEKLGDSKRIQKAKEPSAKTHRQNRLVLHSEFLLVLDEKHMKNQQKLTKLSVENK